MDETVEVEGSGEGVGSDRPARTTEDGIELEEFQPRTQDAEITDA